MKIKVRIEESKIQESEKSVAYHILKHFITVEMNMNV